MRPTVDQQDAMGLVLGAQAGLDPHDLVSRDTPETLVEASRAASVLIAARLRRFAPCRAGGVTWRIREGALTACGIRAGGLVPALVCKADIAVDTGDWQAWNELWPAGATAGQRDLTASLLTLLTTPTDAS
jgi:hypothetical protein